MTEAFFLHEKICFPMTEAFFFCYTKKIAKYKYFAVW